MANKPIKKIAIAGAGGIGSNLVSILYDYGVNRNQFDFMNCKIDVFDDDIVEMGNLLHQNFSEDDIHTMKVQSLAKRFAITPVERFMDEKDFPNYDLIFCAVDSMSFRKKLYEWSWNNPDKAFWIDGRCESRTGSVFNKTNKKETLEKLIDDTEHRAGCLLAFEKEQKTSHTTPIVVAATMFQVFLNYIRDVSSLPEKIFMI